MDKDRRSQDPGPSIPFISCAVCRHEIPTSEAMVAEATDYLVYFCGLDCYQRWRECGNAAAPVPGN